MENDKKFSISKNYYNELLGRQHTNENKNEEIEVTYAQLEKLIEIMRAHKKTPVSPAYRTTETPFGSELFSTQEAGE